MEKIPNIVRQRMAAQQPAGVHPDADQLAAFAEQRLASAERNIVLTHLATCADCREVVALAAPEIGNALPVASSAGATSRWWTMPAFQWGAAAAMAAIAVGLFVLNPAQREQATKPEPQAVVSQAKQPPAPAEPKESDKAIASDLKPRSRPAGFLAARKAEGSAGGRLVMAPGAVPNADSRPKTMASADEERYALKDSRAPAKNEPASAAVTASANETVAVTSARPTIQPAEAEKKADVLNARLSAATAPAAPTAARAEAASKRKAATLPLAGVVSGNVNSQAADELAVGTAGPAVEQQRAHMSLAKTQVTRPFRIASGRLQRYDAGTNSWDDVSVGTAARLSVVGNLANEVWVGGADGAMFYSNDLGAHWIPITTGGWSKDATFAGLTPTARQSVEVYLSNGERWRSADAGASWTRYQ